MKPDIFDFIDKHNLHDGVKEKVLSVFQLYIDNKWYIFTKASNVQKKIKDSNYLDPVIE